MSGYNALSLWKEAWSAMLRVEERVEFLYNRSLSDNLSVLILKNLDAGFCITAMPLQIIRPTIFSGGLVRNRKQVITGWMFMGILLWYIIDKG